MLAERPLQRGDYVQPRKDLVLCARQVGQSTGRFLQFKPRQCKTHPGDCYKFVSIDEIPLAQNMKTHTCESPAYIPWPTTTTKKLLEQHCFRLTKPVVAPARRPELCGVRELASGSAPEVQELSALAKTVFEEITTKTLEYAQEPLRCPMSSPEGEPCRIIHRGQRQTLRYIEAGAVWTLAKHAFSLLFDQKIAFVCSQTL